MSKKPSVKTAELSLMSVPAFWPMAMAAAMMEEGTELYAKNLKFAEEEIKIHDELRPTLATPNTVAPALRGCPSAISRAETTGWRLIAAIATAALSMIRFTIISVTSFSTPTLSAATAAIFHASWSSRRRLSFDG